MKKVILTLSVIALAFAVSACQKDSDEKKIEKTAPYAPEVYWNDSYSGKLGLQLGSTKSGKPRMTLGGELLYVTGVNCYNLFVQCHEADRMGTAMMERTVKVLEEEQVPIVRFSCSPFYASQMHYYTEQKEQFLSNLKKLADLCDQRHILLIPSVFWNKECFPEYCGEEIKAWGNTSSKTYKLMIDYTKDIVNTLKDHKCLAAWEFGNEFNLGADIDIAGYAEFPAAAVETACKGFAETVASLDPQDRLILSGHSVMRNAQWNLAHNKSWATDSFKQYVEITGVMTPKPMNGMSEHVYDEPRVFSDLGELNLSYQVAKAKEAAATLGKAYYIGEFTGPKTAKGDSTIVKRHYSMHLSQKVQLSLIWNYALKGDIEWSFKAGTEYGNMAFGFMRRYNNKFKEIKPE